MVLPIEPTSREIRSLRNLIQGNAIWEKVGHKYLVQFDDHTGNNFEYSLTNSNAWPALAGSGAFDFRDQPNGSTAMNSPKQALLSRT